MVAARPNFELGGSGGKPKKKQFKTNLAFFSQTPVPRSTYIAKSIWCMFFFVVCNGLDIHLGILPGKTASPTISISIYLPAGKYSACVVNHDDLEGPHPA